MLAVVVISVIWTSWLLFLAVTPTRTANFLMDTETFDDGRFWLIVEFDTATVALSSAGLLTVALAYVYILLMMLLWRKELPRALGKLCSRLSSFSLLKAFIDRKICCPTRFDTVMDQWHEITGFQGAHRKYWVGLVSRLLRILIAACPFG